MKLENQVVSLELAKKLKELGVKQESFFEWYGLNDKSSVRIGNRSDWLPGREEILCSAFTVAELGEMLPECYASAKVEQDNGYVCWDENDEKAYHEGRKDKYAPTEADARAKMLIYLLENKLITNEKKNL